MYTIEQIRNQIFCGDALKVLKELPGDSVSCVMTSPPYFALRDYGIDGQLGIEPNWQLYMQHLCEIFDEVKRVLRYDGTVFVNIGDSYNDKSLIQIPERFSLMMTDKLEYIKRNTIIWYKPNCMPSSVDDRFTIDFEPVFFFTKNQDYYFEQQLENISETYANDKRPRGVLRQRLYDNSKYVKAGMIKKETKSIEESAMRTDKRNKRCVWEICPQPSPDKHFAMFPEELCVSPILAGCPEYICKKCGKTKTKIFQYKDNGILNKGWDNKTAEHVSVGKTSALYTREVMEKQFKGYSDCGCNADFDKGIVLDMFAGSGTTLRTARKLHRDYVGIELNPEYIKIIEDKLAQQYLDL